MNRLRSGLGIGFLAVVTFLAACTSAPPAAKHTASSQANVQPSQSAKELAKRILAMPNITFGTGQDASTRDVLYVVSQGKPAPTTCSSAPNGTTSINTDLLRFLIDAGRKTHVVVNSLTDGCHSPGSLHYQGDAVDLDRTSGPLNLIELAADSHGLSKSAEANFYHFQMDK